MSKPPVQYRITIGGCEWSLIIYDAPTVLTPDGVEVYGMSDLDRRTIHMAGRMEKGFFNRTLLHELIHAMLGSSGLTQLLDDKLEEAICMASETFLAGLVDIKQELFIKEKKNDRPRRKGV